MCIKDTASTCEFVALSHVRSQNLVLDGNSKCSLQRLQGLANELLQFRILLSLGITLQFWIDTICIPEDHRKRVATEKIKRVFELLQQYWSRNKVFFVKGRDLFQITSLPLNVLLGPNRYAHYIKRQYCWIILTFHKG